MIHHLQLKEHEKHSWKTIISLEATKFSSSCKSHLSMLFFFFWHTAPEFALESQTASKFHRPQDAYKITIASLLNQSTNNCTSSSKGQNGNC